MFPYERQTTERGLISESRGSQPFLLPLLLSATNLKPMVSDSPTLREIAMLNQRATEAAHNSYSPYSNFRVGAALMLEGGEIVVGTNVENASYRLTSCAEQGAIATAVAQYGPGIRIKAIAIVNLEGVALTPCGACRQTILEFGSPETIIYYPSTSGETTASTIADMLPSAFRLKV